MVIAGTGTAMLAVRATRLMRTMLVMRATRLGRAMPVMRATRLGRAMLVMRATRLGRAMPVMRATRFGRAVWLGRAVPVMRAVVLMWPMRAGFVAHQAVSADAQRAQQPHKLVGRGHCVAALPLHESGGINAGLVGEVFSRQPLLAAQCSQRIGKSFVHDLKPPACYLMTILCAMNAQMSIERRLQAAARKKRLGQLPNRCKIISQSCRLYRVRRPHR